MVIPTAPAPPKLRSKGRQLEDFLSSAFSLSSISGMSGCCEVTVPLGKYDGCPVSVSLVVRYGADRFLLDTLSNLYPSFQKQAEIASSSKSFPMVGNQIKAAEISKEKGNVAYKGKQWHKAVNFYSEAIKLNDKNATYYRNRAADYFGLFQHFHTLALTGIPTFGAHNRTSAYRFVTLVDVMYDNKAKLLCSEEVSSVELLERIVTMDEAKRTAPRTSSRSQKNEADLCV